MNKLSRLLHSGEVPVDNTVYFNLYFGSQAGSQGLMKISFAIIIARNLTTLIFYTFEEFIWEAERVHYTVDFRDCY